MNELTIKELFEYYEKIRKELKPMSGLIGFELHCAVMDLLKIHFGGKDSIFRVMENE